MNMKTFKPLFLYSVFLAIIVTVVFWLVSLLGQAAVFAVFFGLGAVLALVTYKNMLVFKSEITGKYKGLENLLLDLRDGTKKFYTEKRKYARVSRDITAKLLGREGCDGFVRVLDISYGGALLNTKNSFKEGEVLSLLIYLPLFPQPIKVEAKVKRSSPSGVRDNEFNIGVEFSVMEALDREKLKETVDVLERNPSR